jgi:hypothetical protein
VTCVVEQFASDFDNLPALIEDAPSVRVLIAPGLLVHAFRRVRRGHDRRLGLIDPANEGRWMEAAAVRS